VKYKGREMNLANIVRVRLGGSESGSMIDTLMNRSIIGRDRELMEKK